MEVVDADLDTSSSSTMKFLISIAALSVLGLAQGKDSAVNICALETDEVTFYPAD